MFVAKDHHLPLERLTKLIDDGLVVPTLERAYPLAEAADAMRHLEAGRVRGKVVVIP